MDIVRPFLRVLFYWISFMVLLFVSGSALNMVLQGSLHRSVYGGVACVAALFLTWIFSGRRKDLIQEYGLFWRKGSGGALMMGLLIGAGLMLLLIMLLLFFTPLRLSPKQVVPGAELVWWLLQLVLFAYLEEVAFRGLPLVELTKKYGFLTAQCLVALFFAIYHIIYGWPVMVAFMGPFVWSFIFGLARQYSRGIAMPTGIHIALNAGQVILGVRPDVASLFVMDVPGQVTPAMQSQIDLTGIIIHVTIAVAGIALSYRYFKRSSIIAG